MDESVEKVLEVIELVNQVLLKNMQVGDPPNVINLGNMNMVVDKIDPSVLVNSAVAAPMGNFNITIPNINGSCYERKVNIYVFII